MRKIIVAEFMSLDGVIESPAWSFPYWSDQISDFKEGEQTTVDSLLLGRVTYEMFAQAWPQSTDVGAPWMNSVPKYVVTSTLSNFEWNNSRAVKGDLVEEITKLKQQEGGDFLIYGSGKLINALIEHDLVDRYSLLVYPVVLGTGQKLFEDGAQTTLKLIESKSFSSGVVGVTYEPDRK